jgi:acyl-CoA ligase (AMP-forming) (exosortase A-associated)
MKTALHHLIAGSAANCPDAPALSWKDSTLTYSVLWERTSAVGKGLLNLGLTSGDRVGVFLEKRPETVVAVFGVSAARGVFVPINPIMKPAQVRYILRDCGVRVLITSTQRFATLREELSGCDALEYVILIDLPAGEESADSCAPRVRRWQDVQDPQTDSELPTVVDSDMAAILYTSGSTGKPKGVVLSHRNLIVGAESVSSYLENSARDVILAALPLSFDAGFSQLTTAFSVGAHVVLLNYLLPKDVVRLCGRHGVTGITCVPPLWIQIAELAWPPEVANKIRYFANTGGRMPRSTLQRLRDHFPTAKPYLMYGLTEAFRSTYLDPGQVDKRPDSIGKAIPNAEILVVRADGSPCRPGEEGELVHRGPLVAMGYWADPTRTAERFRPAPGPQPDWRAPELAVWSGDTVTTDAEGFLYFVGRRDDMIKTSGYRVSPTEIEESAYGTGLVRDAVAFGLPDPVLGQRVVLVASAPSADGLDTDRLLREMRRELPLYMVPGEVRVLDQLPRSPNGKFDRNRLRNELTT